MHRSYLLYDVFTLPLKYFLQFLLQLTILLTDPSEEICQALILYIVKGEGYGVHCIPVGRH